jgi:predicted RNase H-like HicB family nuclease
MLPLLVIMGKILVIVEKAKDGWYSVYSPETKSTVLNGQGNTVQEAIASMKESLAEVLESYEAHREVIPEELTGEITFQYKYDIPSLFENFDEINLSGFARKYGFNESLLRKYKNRLAFASGRQCLKIEQCLHHLGRSLCEVKILHPSV